jgi:predicted ribosome quality control (RQC) complex YloA/Tae2 family protein
MHQNALFLDRLVKDLNPILDGQRLLECFSISKEDLYFVFDTICIKGSFFNGTLFLEFPDLKHLPQKNRQSQFPQLFGQKVKSLDKHPLNRSFGINFKSNAIVFKCYGRNSNILLMKEGTCIDIFRGNLKSDLEIESKDFILPFKSLSDLEGNGVEELGANYRFLSADILDYLDGLSGDMLSRLKQFQELSDSDLFQFYKKENEQFGMQYASIPVKGEIIESGLSSIEVLNRYSRWHLQKVRFDSTFRSIHTELNRSLKKKNKKLQMLERELVRLQTKTPYFQIADVIMANLHQIETGLSQVELLNFYSNETITIPLKKDLSPQKNAEKYYKKGKNSDKELHQVESQIAGTKQEITDLQDDLNELASANTLKQLQKWQKEAKAKKEQQIDPFRMFEHNGYAIWVGKSSNNNDQLLRQSHKDDIWMHARNVGGSHVIIRNHKKEGIPKSVIEFAASLAAYFSKSRNESLAEVIYTSRKYVRKFKGALPGQVKVDQEEVILVEPHKR